MNASQSIPRFEYGLKFEEFDQVRSRAGFIGGCVARPRPVMSQNGEGVRRDLKDLLRADFDLRRAEDSSYKRDSFKFGTFSYATNEYGIETVLDERRVKRYRDIIDCESCVVASQHDLLARKFEIQAASLLYGGEHWELEGESDYATTLSASWDTHATATPVSDVEEARLKITAMCGVEPNALILNRRQYHHLCECNDIKDRVMYSSSGATPEMLTPSAIAELLGLRHVLVGNAYKNTANRGLDAVIESVWPDDYAMLAIVAESTISDDVCIARAHMWSLENLDDWGGQRDVGVICEQYRAEDVRADVIRSRADWSIDLMHKEAGHLLRGVLSS